MLKMGVTDKCCKCGDNKEDYELTIHLVTPYHHELMCDDCHGKHRSRYDKDTMSGLSSRKEKK